MSSDIQLSKRFLYIQRKEPAFLRRSIAKNILDKGKQLERKCPNSEHLFSI